GRVEVHVESEDPYDEYPKGRSECCHFSPGGQERSNCHGGSFEGVGYPHVKRNDCHLHSEPNDKQDNCQDPERTNFWSCRRERTRNGCEPSGACDAEDQGNGVDDECGGECGEDEEFHSRFVGIRILLPKGCQGIGRNAHQLPTNVEK